MQPATGRPVAFFFLSVILFFSGFFFVSSPTGRPVANEDVKLFEGAKRALLELANAERWQHTKVYSVYLLYWYKRTNTDAAAAGGSGVANE
jgi:hypothetical protein